MGARLLCSQAVWKVVTETKKGEGKWSLVGANRNVGREIINTLRTGDADLHFYITTVQDG